MVACVECCVDRVLWCLCLLVCESYKLGVLVCTQRKTNEPLARSYMSYPTHTLVHKYLPQNRRNKRSARIFRVRSSDSVRLSSRSLKWSVYFCIFFRIPRVCMFGLALGCTPPMLAHFHARFGRVHTREAPIENGNMSACSFSLHLYFSLLLCPVFVADSLRVLCANAIVPPLPPNGLYITM